MQKVPYIVVGLGQTGLSCVRYLKKQGYDFAIADTRTSPEGLRACQQIAPEVPYSLGPLHFDYLRHAETLVVSPGIATSHPALAAARAHGIRIIGDIELFAEQHKNRDIIGITGTNGKGTVTTLLGNMAQLAGKNVIVGGNIGVPVLDLVDETPDLFVLELSSFQLETTSSLNTVAATILNISPDHLDRYPSLEAYAQSKQTIYQNCKIKVVNGDDPLAMPRGTQWRDEPHILFQNYSDDPYAFHLREREGECWLMQGSDPLIPTRMLKMKGTHNYLNALSALALGHAYHLPLSAMIEALMDFSGLPHRCQWIASYGGVSWYNDSKATNIGATIASITGIAQGKNLILIAGGDAKGADLSELQPYLAQHVKHMILLGKDGPKLAEIGKGYTGVSQVLSLNEAVQIAGEIANPGDTVLLAPACASIDMFRDYSDRGTQFANAVKDIWHASQSE